MRSQAGDSGPRRHPRCTISASFKWFANGELSARLMTMLANGHAARSLRCALQSIHRARHTFTLRDADSIT
jgi:hypothetical protein